MRSLFAVSWLCLGLISSPVFAQTDEAAPNGYQAAIDEAVSAFAAQDWPVARASFARAHAIAPSARTWRGLGLSLFYLRDYVAAREAFEQALADQRKPLSPEQTAEVDRFLRSTKLETGSYELSVTPSTAQVSIDGMPRELGKVVLARGPHALEINASGYVTHRDRLTVEGGEERVITIGLEPLAGVTQPTTDGGSTPPAAVSGSEVRPRARLFTWIALGAVPVFAGIGTAVWFSGKGEFDSLQKRCETSGCSDEEIADAHLSRYATWTSVSFAAAGAALVSGVVLYFVEGAPSASSKDKGPTAFTVSPSGFELRGRF